jgi:tetratricopeptide (TPR) repeat protein
MVGYYLQGKKPDQFEQMKESFFSGCQRSISLDQSEDDYHFLLAQSAFQLTTYLGQKEIYAISVPPFQFFHEWGVKINFLFHWKDVLMMQEMLMQRAIDEHIELIRENPTDLSVHTSLANAYIASSKIYTERPLPATFNSSMISKLLNRPFLSEKSAKATQKAIEELKILDDLAPNDPWVHAQLANCYHHLNLHDEEIHEYEILLNLRPSDKEILHRLGLLYFKLGKNAKGLTIYKRLHQIDAAEGKHLLHHYLG